MLLETLALYLKLGFAVYFFVQKAECNGRVGVEWGAR
jgi:hypothetical protein